MRLVGPARAGTVAFALLSLLARGAGAQSDADAREAAIFGGPGESASSTTATVSSQPARDDAIFGPSGGETSAGADGDRDAGALGPQTSAGLVEERLRESADYLAIGGLIWLRLQYNGVDADHPSTFPLDSPNFADVYFDARPNDRVRGYARGRLRLDPTVREGQVNAFGQVEQTTRVQLDQLWLKFDIDRFLFVTLGKERLKWGVGRFWNPTDFLNQETLDPLGGVALFDERLGVNLLKLHLPIESLGWNFYAAASTDQAVSPDHLGGVLKAEILVAQTEVSVSVAGRKDNPARLGATVSTGLWLFDLRAEVGLQHGNRSTFLRGTCAPAVAIADINSGNLPEGFTDNPSLDAFPALGTAYSRRDDWIPQVLGGAELGLNYGDGDVVYVGAEYFFNDAGYDDSSLYPCLAARGGFTPFYLGRHYAAAYVLFPQPGLWNDTTFILSSLANLSDLSNVTRIDYRVKVLTYLDVNAFASVSLGQAGDEFTFATKLDPVTLPAGTPSEVTARLAADPRFALLLSGLEVPKPIFQVGFGLSLAY